MVEWIVKALVVAFILWVLWSLLQPHYTLEIRVASGQPSVRRGKVTTAFLGQVTAVCLEYGVLRGWIGGVRQGRRMTLRFSRDFPRGAQQRLRNEWTLAR